MVLPASSVAHAPRQGVEPWIQEILAGLHLSPAGVLILVDGATPEVLGRFVRTIIVDFPDLEVLISPEDLESLPDGSVAILVPPQDSAPWLNEHRPLFARKSLKVVLWCDRAISEELSQKAPDFFDWIAQRQECPLGVPEHAVCGLRKALLARAPGVIFHPQTFSVKSVERVFKAAFPGRRLLWLAPSDTPYSVLVRQVRAARGAWVACVATTHQAAERFRWALAEARRRTRAILLLRGDGDDWFWNVTDHLYDLPRAATMLSKAGARRPGVLAAVGGLESAVTFGTAELLIRGYDEDAILTSMLSTPDPGAGLADRLLSSGVTVHALQGHTMPPPVQRRLGRHVALRRLSSRPIQKAREGWLVHDGGIWPLLRSLPRQIEVLLRAAPRTVDTWEKAAHLAFEHGDFDVAATWSETALSLRESPAMLWIHGAALANLGIFNWERGAPIATTLLASAMTALDRLVADGDPALPLEDVFALHAVRADVLSRVGLPGEQEDAVFAADRLLQIGEVRTGDLLRFARVLCRKGRLTRAEELARSALAKTRDSDERMDAISVLSICALALGRPAEALSLSAQVLKETSPSEVGREGERRLEAERVHIDALFAEGRTKEALSFMDETVHRASLRDFAGHGIAEQAFWRLPLFAIALRRAGRLNDAEQLLRKLLGLPTSGEPGDIGAGLLSQGLLQHFLANVWPPAWMETGMRSKLEIELAKTLRAQGRHAEADAIKPDLVKLDTL